MVKRRLLSLLGAAPFHDSKSCLFSSQHGFFAPQFKSRFGFEPPSHFIRFISLYKLSKENCIPSYHTPRFSHLNRYGSFSTSATAPNTAIKCWACGKEAPDGPFLACPSCKSVQPLDSSLNYFHIFNLYASDNVIMGDYLAESLDMMWMPRIWKKSTKTGRRNCILIYFNASPRSGLFCYYNFIFTQEKEYSAQQSAQVITAYNTLLKPLSRAEYMLQLQGIHVDEERTVTDPELLMEIMEVRESVEDADNDDALKSIQNKMQSKLEECQMSFATAYQKLDFTSAVSAIQKMSYYERANAEIIKKL